MKKVARVGSGCILDCHLAAIGATHGIEVGWVCAVDESTAGTATRPRKARSVTDYRYIRANIEFICP